MDSSNAVSRPGHGPGHGNGNGPGHVGMISILPRRSRKKAKQRSAGHRLLIMISVIVLLCYFAMTIFIIYTDRNVNADLFNDETLYWKKKGAMTINGESDVGGGGETIKESIKESGSGDVGGSSKKKHDDDDGDGDDKVKDKVKVKVDTDKINTSTTITTSNVLTAFIEPIHQEDWKVKPLPVRNVKASDLKKETFTRIACSTLPEQFPTNEETAPTNKDPFLPWIHDVFPSADGKYVQFIAQNKRRCQSGIQMVEIKKFMQPNVALFQHVPVTRINYADSHSHSDADADASTGDVRYRISSHEEADEDAVETRFICRFKPSMIETLSVHNLNYDYHSVRKAYKATFTEEGFDNHMIWSSQLLFKCPVPKALQENIRLGTTVEGDYATQFVDLIPIRTPPRYGHPTTYLPPRLYHEKNSWDPKLEWGDHHILPKIEDSGRWENIPICKPSLMTYPDEGRTGPTGIDPTDTTAIATQSHDAAMAQLAKKEEKKKLIACTWTSASFETRGGKTTVNDGDQRLLQWLEFNKLVGVDHVYIYDNTGAFSDTNSLKPITDMFPGFVTRINWPAKICNNNPGNGDNKGERSSQYAATMSCQLRFGAHSDWLASFGTSCVCVCVCVCVV